MLVETHNLRFPTQGFCHVVEITGEIQANLDQGSIRNGTVTIFVVGSTGGVTTVEYEPGCVQDMEDLYNRLIPPTRDYHHEKAWHDGNGFSHMRASLLKPSLVVPVVDGRLRLGTWQQVVVLNFDNKPRQREVCLQVVGVE